VFVPCQIGGIRFLYDNLVESLERFKTSSGFGCILAHSMGLGKTLQVISFIDVLFRHTPAKTVLAIVPVSVGAGTTCSPSAELWGNALWALKTLVGSVLSFFPKTPFLDLTF